MTSSHRWRDAAPSRAGKLTRDALRLLETGTPRCQTNRGVSVARPFAHGPRSLTSDGLYGSNLVLPWWRELNPRSWSEPNASPGLILLKNTHQRPWIMAFLFSLRKPIREASFIQAHAEQIFPTSHSWTSGS